jgi:hypothetical protein
MAFEGGRNHPRRASGVVAATPNGIEGGCTTPKGHIVVLWCYPQCLLWVANHHTFNFFCFLFVICYLLFVVCFLFLFEFWKN